MSSTSDQSLLTYLHTLKVLWVGCSSQWNVYTDLFFKKNLDMTLLWRQDKNCLLISDESYIGLRLHVCQTLLIWGKITKQADHRRIHQQTMSVWGNRFQINHTSNAAQMVWENKDSFFFFGMGALVQMRSEGKETERETEHRSERFTFTRDLCGKVWSLQTREKEKRRAGEEKPGNIKCISSSAECRFQSRASLDAHSQFPSLSPRIAFNKAADGQIRQNVPPLKITANSNKSNIHFTPPL